MSLSSSEQEALDTLLAVTASDSHEAQRRDLDVLRDTNFDVQAALEVIFASQAQAPSTFSQQASSSRRERPPSSSSSSRPYTRFSVDDSQQSVPSSSLNSTPTPPGQPGSGRSAGVRVPRGFRGVTRVGLGLGWTLYTIIIWPVQVVFTLVIGGWAWLYRHLPESLTSLLPDALVPRQAIAPGASTHRRGPAALRFLLSLEDLTNARSPSSVGHRGMPSPDQEKLLDSKGEDGEEIELPEFHTGGYKEALEQAKRQGRIVLVGLFSDKHQSDTEWKKTVLTDPSLVNAFKTYDVLLWAGDVKDREPHQVARLLPPTTFPSLTFISLLPSSPSRSSSSSTTLKLSVLSRHEGPTVTAADLCTHLEQSTVPRTQAILERVQRETRQREEERRLRQEQDRAFQHSQDRDVARIMKIREEKAVQEALQQAEEAKQREAEREEEREEVRARARLAYLRFARSSLLPAEPPLDDKLAVSITLRLPPTHRPFKLRFSPSTSLEHLYLWADTLTIPDSFSPADDPDSLPTEAEVYDHTFCFRLATSYPRSVLELSDGDGTVGGSPVLKAGGWSLVYESLQPSARNFGSDDDEEESSEEE